MKFVNNGFAKKLIMVLAIIILFNAIVPQTVHAGFVESIILKPFFGFIAAIVGSIDVFIGWILNMGIGPNGPVDIGSAMTDLWDGDADLGDAGYFMLGVDSIFAGNVHILNANIFEETGNELRDGIRNAVAGGYVVLRNICAVIMLIGLVYTGIQILINSNIPTKKTQYLMLIQDWVIGMCLLLLSHVIMTTVFEISELFINGFQQAITPTTGASSMNGHLLEMILGCDETFAGIMATIPLILLICLFIYQCFDFGLAYLRRLVYVCALIIFAPIFSVMYAFGQQTKQIYSKWLREFITAVLIQPFHIVMYYVIIILPLEGNPSGGLTLFEITFVAACIFMFKPIEAYIKNLVGLNTGIAGSTSAEGGRAIANAAIKSGVGVYEGFMAVHDAKKNGASAFEIMGANFRDKYMSSSSVGENMQRLAREDEPGTALDESNPQRDQEKEQLAQENGQVQQGLPQGTEDKDDTNEEQLASMMGQQMEELQNNNNEETTSLNAANITIGSANIDMPEFGGNGQFALQEQTEQLREGDAENRELSSELMEDTKKLLDDPRLGLTDEQKEEYLADPQKLANDLPGMKKDVGKISKAGAQRDLRDIRIWNNW